MKRRAWLVRLAGVGVAVAAVALNRPKLWVVIKTQTDWLGKVAFPEDDRWGLASAVIDAQTGKDVSFNFPLSLAGELRRKDICTLDLYARDESGKHVIRDGDVVRQRTCVIVVRRESVSDLVRTLTPAEVMSERVRRVRLA